MADATAATLIQSRFRGFKVSLCVWRSPTSIVSSFLFWHASNPGHSGPLLRERGVAQILTRFCSPFPRWLRQVRQEKLKAGSNWKKVQVNLPVLADTREYATEVERWAAVSSVEETEKRLSAMTFDFTFG